MLGSVVFLLCDIRTAKHKRLHTVSSRDTNRLPGVGAMNLIMMIHGVMFVLVNEMMGCHW